VLVPVRVFFLWGTDLSAKVAFPFPGGYTIGFALLFNLLAAHIVRFQPKWHRIGIWIIHIGIVLLMLGELFTGLFAVESRMVIEEGKSTNYLESHRQFELAFVDTTTGAMDDVVVLPAPKLRRAKGRIADDRLPAQVEVVKYMVNSNLDDASAAQGANPATHGAGKSNFAAEKPEVSGVDQDQPIDLPAVYARMLDKSGAELGVWLFQPDLKPQVIELNGKKYEVSLRAKRTYKPFSLHLKKFTHELYPGTDTPKDFRSHVRLIDPSNSTDREIEIYMNTPLRYEGETYYQSSFLDPRRSGTTGTILQVVHNPAWTMPYISCIVATIGMLIHFGIVLARYVQKRTSAPNSTNASVSSAMPLWTKALIGVFVGTFVLYTLGAMFRPVGGNKDGQRLSDLASLPVVEGGRVKPMETVGRTYLRTLSNRSEFFESYDKDEDHKLSATRWLLDVMVMGYDTENDQSPARNHPVVRIENEQVLAALKLQPKRGLRYRITDVAGSFGVIEREARRAAEVPADKATLFDAKITELHKHLQSFVKLAQFTEPAVLPPDEKNKDWRPLPFYALHVQASEMARALVREELGLTREELSRLDEKQQMALIQRMRQREAEIRKGEYDRLEALQPPLVLRWRDLLIAHRDKQRAEEARRKATPGSSEQLKASAAVATATEQFNSVLAEIRERTNVAISRGESSKLKTEVFFNKFNPFVLTMVLFSFGLALSCIGLVVWEQPLRWTSWLLILLAVIVHTSGLLMRMYIQGRPPVTNLYSSAIFIGWGAVLLSLLLELFRGRGILNLVGAAIGVVTSIVAHNLGSSDDTLQMMQAVLDTNFWLATHVVCITFGYTATFFAGFLGIMFIVLGLFTPKLDSDLFKRLNQRIYGVVCFATLLSFTGTVLGGIWADQSWGRFWGWDPKENGAVLIVFWNAILLHARWAGLIKQRGLAVMAVFGNIVTAWSWFGTNMLGIGLHAYGFMEAAVPAILAFDGLMIVLMLIAAFPPRHWSSFGGQFDKEMEVLPVDAGRAIQNRVKAGARRANLTAFRK
jgi:ABC-type transport system involved in cytochrome c biogenesis permease subunit